MANENWSPGKGQQIPNGPIKTQPYLTTISPDNPDGYVKLVPNAPSTNPLFKLEYSVQTGDAPGVVSLRIIDDGGNVRRQFNSFQELADSGYNFGFAINAESINRLKTQLASELTTSSNDILSGATSPSPYFTGTLPPPSQGEQPPPVEPGAPSYGGGSAPQPGDSDYVEGTGGTIEGLKDISGEFGQEKDRDLYSNWKDFLQYPENISSSGQDRLIISQIQYVAGDLSNTLSGSLSRRE